jgi:hypothetical protein
VTVRRALLLLLMMTGCAAMNARRDAEQQFSDFHNCPKDKVDSTGLDDGSYRVYGCNESEVYVCNSPGASPNSQLTASPTCYRR